MSAPGGGERRRGPGGPGRGGGLLFLGVLVFVGYLAVTALAGAARWIVLAAIAAGILVLAGDVRRRH